MIDGVGQKYLNFGKENTGAIITPSFGTSVVTSLALWPANDAEPRDPASYQLYGTNAAITAAAPGDTVALSLFNLISEQAVTLPSDRNPGGSTPLSGTNFVTSTFANTAAYSSYLILFDALKDSGNANSMQIGEVQLHGVSPVPIPAAIWLLASGLGVLGWCGRARTPAGSC